MRVINEALALYTISRKGIELYLYLIQTVSNSTF